MDEKKKRGPERKSRQEQIREITGFRVVSVFAYEQTEGRELPMIGVNELTGDVKNYHKLFDALKDICPVPICSSGNDTKELKNSLERIRKTADEMITSIDQAMEKQREKSEKKIENERCRSSRL